MRGLSLAGALSALLLAAGTPLYAQAPDAQSPALPQGEGRDLVATACSQCHSLGVILAGRDGPVGWKRHVYNMVLRGAQLTPREADTVIAYLVTHFGPGAPAAAPAPLPAGAGRELVETRCAVCHTLERVTIIKRGKRDWETIVANMYERWGVTAPDEAQTISAYLAAQFGRK
jgi:mono/diheme cytochrome c family protein